MVLSKSFCLSDLWCPRLKIGENGSNYVVMVIMLYSVMLDNVMRINLENTSKKLGIVHGK